MLRRFVLIATALLLSSAASAQTCGGVLELTFIDPTSADSSRPLIAMREFDVRAQFLHGSIAEGALPTVAEALRDHPVSLDADVRLPGYSRVYVPGSVLAFAPRCGLALLHIVIEYHHETMTLDVYGTPSHIGIRLDAPVPFRRGRHVLDLRSAPHAPDGSGFIIYHASGVRRVGS
ncbi:MAG TPA: hypothetical protein VGB53_04805 [Rubricoccaceae bacterium]